MRALFPQCRKLNLLSFGEEAEEEEKELAAVKTKIKSSHDVLDDPRLLKDEVPINDVVIILYLLLCLVYIEWLKCCYFLGLRVSDLANVIIA